MSMYLGKLALHDYDLSQKQSSLVAVGAFYVALRICEQLKKLTLINKSLVDKLIEVSKHQEQDIIEVSQKVLYLAQNFDKEFSGLENLRKTHFVAITSIL